MMILKSMMVITVLMHNALTRDIDRRSSLEESRSRRGRDHHARHDEVSRIQSANNLLKNPHLESFDFIHPAASASAVEVNSKLPTKNIAVLRFRSGTKITKKIFKTKVVLPKIMRSKHRKLRGNVLFPENISSIGGECRWNLRKGNGRKILFVPKACVKMISNIARASLQDHKVFGLLIPKKNKKFGMKKRKITKNLVIVIYGKRMEALLRKLAMKQQSTRLIVSMKKYDRKPK